MQTQQTQQTRQNRMHHIFKLENTIQDYKWGTQLELKRLFGIENPEKKPQAEIWMGAHKKAPSWIIIKGGHKISLRDFIQEDPVSVLGPETACRYNGELPFLFKVLSAAAPLSIQAHPGLEQAAKGFQKENKAGIDINHKERNYKDPNHKPELLYALTPFRALCGFRKPEETAALLKTLNIQELGPQLNRFKTNPTTEGLKAFYTWLMTLPLQKKEEVADRAVESASAQSGRHPVFTLLVDLASHYKSDIGILGAVMLNLVELQPGQAIFLAPGELHAYVHGTGMEIMANSDNVIRGGLTTKHMDVNELLSTLSFNHGEVPVITPVTGKNPCEKILPTPAREFSFTVISTNNQECRFKKRHGNDEAVEILFCGNGTGKISIDGHDEETIVKPGESYLVPAVVPGYRITGDVTLYKATVPIGK